MTFLSLCREISLTRKESETHSNRYLRPVASIVFRFLMTPHTRNQSKRNEKPSGKVIISSLWDELVRFCTEFLFLFLTSRSILKNDEDRFLYTQKQQTIHTKNPQNSRRFFLYFYNIIEHFL